MPGKDGSKACLSNNFSFFIERVHEGRIGIVANCAKQVAEGIDNSKLDAGLLCNPSVLSSSMYDKRVGLIRGESLSQL